MSIPPEIPVLNPNLLPPPVPWGPNDVVLDETSHFNYPGSDIVLRSQDSFNFPLPKLYIVICSPVLRNLIERVSNTSDVPNGEEREAPSFPVAEIPESKETLKETLYRVLTFISTVTPALPPTIAKITVPNGEQPLPVVNIPESKEILYSLLTFIFPVTPILPPTVEKIMELLAVAQKYEMNSVMSHIRGAISLQNPPFLRSDTALCVYFLAQQQGLHHEAVQAARVTLRFPMTIEGLGDQLDFPGMTGAYIHELWKYHEQVRTELKSALSEFRSTGLPDDVKNLMCTSPYYGISSPQWLYDYIDSVTVAGTPTNLFDLTEFEEVLARHVQTRSYGSYGACSCATMPSQVKRSFWEGLTAVVRRTLEKADSTLTLVKDEPTSELFDLPLPSVPFCLDMPEASIIIRSSDQVNFRVHKSVLAMSSPFFKDLLSLPQPPDAEIVDGLPVVALPENAGLLNSLIPLLYPVTPVIPDSYQKAFVLLAVCQKYEMESVESNIRSAMKQGKFPAPVKAECFSAYAIAKVMGLDPEAEDAARLTLDQPMTFESLGEGLRSFKGRALCDLIHYRGKIPKVAAT